MKRVLQAVALAFREALSQPTLQRTPEPSLTMTEAASVEAFHAEGAAHGAMAGVHRFNAQMIDALVPERGTVVDLGCGSGQCLRSVAQHRPDLRLIGLDRSEEMVAAGRAMLAREGLADRVELRVGDMTSFSDGVPARVDLLTCIFALHHLPDPEHLRSCLRELARTRARTGAGFWFFDHVRPRRRATAERFPEVFTPTAPASFKRDSTNSLIASWAFDELGTALRDAVGDGVESRLARPLRLYQVHWATGRLGQPARASAWQEPDGVAGSVLDDAEQLAGLFSKLPR